VRRFHREEEGQHLILAALMMVALAAILVLTMHLGMITHQKIQAQNAADAAALASADWQLRGLCFTQNLNDVVYICDAVTDALLWISVACNYATYAPVVGVIAWGVGNVTLGLSVATNAFVTFVLIPFRDICVAGVFPMICYVSASEMARANGATSLAGIADHVTRLSTDALHGIGAEGMDLTGFGELVGSITEKLPLTAFGVEVGEEGIGLLSLHLERVTTGEYPLKGNHVSSRVLSCISLTPVQPWAYKYFHFIERSEWFKWDHPHYESESELEEIEFGAGVKAKGVKLPPHTWVVSMSETRRGSGSRYPAWCAFWDKAMGGLGVYTGEKPMWDPATQSTQRQPAYDELGSVALASAQTVSETVRSHSFMGLKGAVQMLPVQLVPGEKHSLALGICH